MKKLIAMLLVVGFVTVNLMGCGDTKSTKTTDTKSTKTTTAKPVTHSTKNA
jgi:hypothetical protein